MSDFFLFSLDDNLFQDVKRIFSGIDQEAKAKNSSVVEEIMVKMEYSTKTTIIYEKKKLNNKFIFIFSF